MPELALPGFQSAWNGRKDAGLNRRMGCRLCLLVVKLPSIGLCQITFAGAKWKGNGIILFAVADLLHFL